MKFVVIFFVLNLSGCFFVQEIPQGNYENYVKEMNVHIGKNINNVVWYKNRKDPKDKVLLGYDYIKRRSTFFFYGKEKGKGKFDYYNMAFIYLVNSVNNLGFIDPIEKECITTFKIRKKNDIIVGWQTKSDIKFCKRKK